MTLRFAVVNLVGIYCFFGSSCAIALCALAVLLWCAIRPLSAIDNTRHPRLVTAAGLVALAFLAALFTAYKLYFDPLLTGAVDHADQPRQVSTVYGVLRALSFSYVFLRSVDLVRSTVWGRMKLLDPVSLTGYLGPFHMLISGPISPYADHLKADSAERSSPSFYHLLTACNTVVTGLFFKVVIAQAMKYFLFGVHEPISSQGWFDSAYLLAYMYFDFAGYSLIALGIGRLLDIPTPVNFNRPYLASSVTEFWTRWHMSLGLFVRNNLFLPIQLFLARRCRSGIATTIAALLPLAVAFVFVGMWHRFTLHFILWGAAMAIVMVAEKLVRPRLASLEWMHRRPLRPVFSALGTIYTLAVIITSIHLVSQEVFV